MSKTKNSIQIYNLEFPPFIEELKIGDYTFRRIDNYEYAFNNMMHLVNSEGSEFNTKVQTGNHQITATVNIPRKEQRCSLPWESDAKYTQLDDILLLLTIFTGRSVFRKDRVDDKDIAIIGDHRINKYGGQLICSIKYESMRKDKRNSQLITEKEAQNIPMIHNKYNQVNVGFEKTLNKVFKNISGKRRQESYDGGYFLFLYKNAISRQIIEKSFLSCWTIWEQIFAIENKKWIPDEDLFRIGSDKKIAYILTNYFGKNIDKIGWKNISRMTKSRNRLVHFGKKMDNVTNEEKDMFIRTTEQLIAIILGLQPSNLFNSNERLDKFLST